MRYLIFIFLINSIYGQCLDNHLYTDHLRQTVIATNVDSYSKVNNYIFYRKNNKLYSYSYETGVSNFIDWNVNHFSIGPNEVLAYKKGNSFYVRSAPYSVKSNHVTWNVGDYFWTVDGSLIYKKINSHYILHNTFTEKPKLISTNISRWIISCDGQLAFLKLGNLYYVDNKVEGSTVNVQPNIDKAFFVGGTLYFLKNGVLWNYSSNNNVKRKLIYNVNSYYICREYLYVNSQKGLYVVKGGEALFTGHSGISGVQTSYRGITYIHKNRLYFLEGKNLVELCYSPTWYYFSENGCLYIHRNNNLCFIDDKYKINVIIDNICSPRYSQGRIYYQQNSRRYYLEPALGKITLCK